MAHSPVDPRGDVLQVCKVAENTVRSESRCALGLRYVRAQVCINARGHHFQHLLYVHSDFPNADLRKVFANKIKRFRPV
jgi:hypothetical protein